VYWRFKVPKEQMKWRSGVRRCQHKTRRKRDVETHTLFETHQKLGGKLIEFGGWEMPVQYTSITDEHLPCGRRRGFSTFPHMGEVLVSGTGEVF